MVAENCIRIETTGPRQRAAQLLAEDDLSDREIADAVGVSPRTLANWKKKESFQAAVAAHVAELNAAMRRLAIAQKRKRIATLNKLHDKALELIEERAVALDGEVAGGGTGLLVKTERNFGKVSELEYAADTALMREIRALEEQAAKELGQLKEAPPAAEVRLYVGVAVEDV